MHYVDACHRGAWTLTTKKKETGEGNAMPYRCRSWRHAGECREWCGACDFARICQALSEHSHWTSVVLTYPHRKWKHKHAELFRFGVVSWSRLRKRLIDHFGAFKYIQTWEIHKSGYPHVNIAISNPLFHKLAVDDGDPINPPFLQPYAVGCGFGPRCWATPLYDATGMAAYLTKKALELTGHSHKNQTPVNAPRNFRRLRSSKGLLPKRVKDDTITGALLHLPIETVHALMVGVPVGPGEPEPDIRDRGLYEGME